MWDWVRLDQGVLLFYRDRLWYLYGFQVARLFVFSLDVSVSRRLCSDHSTTCQLSLKKGKTFGIMTNTARTVCSRTTGTTSVNPLNYDKH